MENKLLEEIKTKLINIMPKECEIDVGFQGIKFYRRNIQKKLISVCSAPVLFLLQIEKNILI